MEKYEDKQISVETELENGDKNLTNSENILKSEFFLIPLNAVGFLHYLGKSIYEYKYEKDINKSIIVRKNTFSNDRGYGIVELLTNIPLSFGEVYKESFEQKNSILKLSDMPSIFYCDFYSLIKEKGHKIALPNGINYQLHCILETYGSYESFREEFRKIIRDAIDSYDLLQREYSETIKLIHASGELESHEQENMKRILSR